MSAKKLECFGGPLDGEFRPLGSGRVRMKERCEYAELNPSHPFPNAVYIVVEDRRWGPIFRFEEMVA